MAELELDGVSKLYPGGVQAVQGLSLSVGSELLVLVGNSGCGKTTTLRLVAGLESPSAGSVRIGGREMCGVPPWRRDVALVSQDPALYPHRSVANNLNLAWEWKGGLVKAAWQRWWAKVRPASAAAAAQAAAELRVHRVAETLGIAPMLGAAPHQLSGGERQRVALGRAMARQPRVFLLDEPLAHLDPRSREQARLLVRQVQRQSQSPMLYVTHDQAEALAIADRLAVLENGVLRQLGTPREVYDRPADTHVAQFIGSPPMNLITGRVQPGDDGPRLTAAGAAWPLPGLDGACQLRAGALVTLGVRPEHLRLAASAEDLADSKVNAIWKWRAELVATEWLGDCVLAHLRAGAWRVTARWPADAPPSPEALRIGRIYVVCVEPARVHWFEEPSGKRLTSNGRKAA